jgi:SAM-dependent methyltransferase
MPRTHPSERGHGPLHSDRHFDQVYPSPLRFLSRVHWTPVKVARAAARLLVDAGATSILDVGAGAGKFCIVGALTTSASFVGLEQRSQLVEVARDAAARLGARRVRFVTANIVDADWDGFDGVYLFNPFYEQVGTLIAIDKEAERSRSLYHRYVKVTEQKLATLPSGTVVVTYHGFGGTMPPDYETIHDQPAGNDRLVLWQKS